MKTMNDYFENFAVYLQSDKGASRSTIANYRSDFNYFLLFLENSRIQPELSEMTPELLEEYVCLMKKSGYKHSSIRRRVNSLKSFFSYLVLEGYISSNPVKAIASPKKMDKKPVFLSEEQVAHILKKARESTSEDAFVNYILIRLLADTGIQRQEAINLDFTDIDFKNNQVRIIGRKGVERLIPISQDFTKELWLYRQSRLPLTNNAVFISRTGNRIYEGKCQTIFRRILRYAGFNEEEYSLSVLRNSYAAALTQKGVPVDSIQKLLGHQSINSTSRYVQASI